MKKKLQDLLKPYSARLLLLILPAIFALIILQYLTANSDSDAGRTTAFILTAFIYVITVLVLFGLTDRIVKSNRGIPDIAKKYNPNVNALLYNSISSPIVACDPHGVIRWGNKAFRDISDKISPKVRKFSDVADVGIDQVKSTIDGGKECLLTVGGRNYRIEGRLLDNGDDPLYITVWYDVTEAEKRKNEFEENDALIAYIFIDNLEELSQIEKDNFGFATADAERILFDWAASINAVLVNYERDKFILFYKAKYLKSFIDDKFEILDKIRDIRVGSNYLPITISIGTSNVGGSFKEKRDNAYSALRFALAKGGDQAIVKTDKFSYFFGGMTKTSQKRSSVKSQTIARALSSYICRASNVLIMGHRNPDFDSIGSCVGIARLCMYMKVPCNIIIDKNSANIAKCFTLLDSLDEYKKIFISSMQSADYIKDNTLLIICDVNNKLQFEVSDIAERIGSVVYIDHHRQTAEFTTTPLLSYIEPSASSASELVSEILEQVDDRLLRPEEANLMYAGIVLDTKHFVVNTGVRTFEAARYLRSLGDPTTTQELFRTRLDEMARESRFKIDEKPYRDRIMIAKNDYADNVDSDITIGAKIADRLLTIENIDATFVIMRLGSGFRISARSTGEINVETILRRLGGGGHFNAAGAQADGVTDINEVTDKLLASIDKFIDEELNKIENS